MKTDICLILEGTYPYVHGGVSSWIQRIVTSLSDFTFSIIHLSSTGDVLRTPQYEIPPNILEFKEVFIHDFTDETTKAFGNKQGGWKAIAELYKGLDAYDFSGLDNFYKQVVDKKSRSLNTHDLVFSRQSWDMFLELYNNISPDVSFVDFYWTMRFIHIPLLNLFNIDIPDACLYHTVCTGYAGLLSVIAKISKKAPMLLTEHGIYTYERKIDISRSTWIYSEADKVLRATRSLGFFKDIWIKKFEILSKLTYQYADKIITLFEGNRHMQIEGGADPAKIEIISNGVDFDEEVTKRVGRPKMAKTVGFVGRVVSIKDIKVFIRAMKIVKEKINDVTVYIMGSGDEDPQYTQECKTLATMLQLQNNILFTGVVDVKDYYPRLDVMVLTSVSEAQPLSILEAMSLGVPIVATDVGSCKELIVGASPKDKALGRAGIITTIGSPQETANAVLEILEDNQLHNKMAQTGIKRVQRYYDADTMVESYRQLYEAFLKKSLINA